MSRIGDRQLKVLAACDAANAKLARQSENEERAQRGRNAIDAYIVESGDDESALTDLLADLMHRSAADCEAENFNDALRKARMHFDAETEKVAA